jgi:DNA repair protein RadC
VVLSVLEHNAANVILAHNHPSGIAEPSEADLLITARLREALSLIDAKIIDHIVIGSGQTYSFADHGLI